MYWPLGAPKVFEQQLPLSTGHASFDGLGDSRSHRIHRSARNAEGASQPSLGEDAGRRHNDGETADDKNSIICIRMARSGHVFATITENVLTVWNTKPTTILSTVVRSRTSLKTYGPNVDLVIRPDAAILVIQTSKGFLITYSLVSESESYAYELVFTDGGKRHKRRKSMHQYNGLVSNKEKGSLLGVGGLAREYSLGFRMVIRLDAGIVRALALDDEIVIATENPAAIQCIRWTTDRPGTQASTELLSNMQWLDGSEPLKDIFYDRPMSIYCFITAKGEAYAVRRNSDRVSRADHSGSSLAGHVFHSPAAENEYAIKAVVNSKFSLIALGLTDGSVVLYTVRDYMGGINFLRKLDLPLPQASCGKITCMTYTSDGHCLFVGYDRGWMTWSVYGQPGGSSFNSDSSSSQSDDENWLLDVKDAAWIGASSDIVLLTHKSSQLWILEFAKSAATNCFNSANIAKALLQSSTGFMVYQGHQLSDLTTIAADVSLWQHIQAPPHYFQEQWPMRAAVISPDERYLAIAGQRGLAHYSMSSGRWKTFEDLEMQNDFCVRGGMFWHYHILVVAVESTQGHEIRLYSRELALDNAKALFVEKLESPIIYIAPTGEDSVLVYTAENALEHYVIDVSRKSIRLAKVGRITLHGIIRSPARVRAVSWVVPDHQLQHGDPSKDVVVASIIFLVDGKLVLLQPTTTDEGDLKYDMRVIANDVEYYMLARDNPTATAGEGTDGAGPEIAEEAAIGNEFDRSLRDSLWVFDGQQIKVWTDVNELLKTTSADATDEMQTSISIQVDFYPLSALLQRGILFGVEAELVQRRDITFAFFRTLARSSLFLPNVLRHHLAQYDSPAALHLAHHFQHLPYFAHALEVLLHNVLDDEVEETPTEEKELLPTVLSFLSSFPDYLDIVVQCTRKTELRSWQTLFRHLPPPNELFEMALQSGSLKTAGGYLLVLHTLAEIRSDSPQVIKLMRAAMNAQDWELCKELARFLMALDTSGNTLRRALQQMDLEGNEANSSKAVNTSNANGLYVHTNGLISGVKSESGSLDATSGPAEVRLGLSRSPLDYFSS